MISFVLKRISILNVANSDIKEKIPKEIEYVHLPLNNEIVLEQEFNEITDKIHKMKKPLIVNCFKGKNRSVGVVASYLMKYEKFSLEEALKLIASKRLISLTPKLMKNLKAFEEHLKARSI